MLRPSPVGIGQIFSGEVFDPQKVDALIAAFLPWKLVFVFLVIAAMLYHDLTSILAAKQHEGPSDSAPGNRAGTFAAALATFLSIAVLYLSVRLVRG
jgi:hypothetical protein